jgi:hypothetical protein
LENWVDLLAFVPRRQLGKIVPKIGDRKFAKFVQFFLHKTGELTLDYIHINEPTDEDKATQNGRPLVKLWQHDELVPDLKLPDWPMPENIKNFHYIRLRFLLPIFFYSKEFILLPKFAVISAGPS